MRAWQDPPTPPPHTTTPLLRRTLASSYVKEVHFSVIEARGRDGWARAELTEKPHSRENLLTITSFMDSKREIGSREGNQRPLDN